jgi:UDP-2,4-diacetamido-2,4,6-trideoxy-beta-L-altropyranose hydrolase
VSPRVLGSARESAGIALNTPSANPGTLLIRADANSAIGTGHVMRCLALAQAWQDAGGQVTFACTELPPFLSQRLETEGCIVSTIDAAPGTDRDLAETRRLAESIAPKWLVLDGYAFGPDYQLTLRDVKWRLLFIDDDGRHENYHADAILNQNAGAAAVLYGKRTHNTRLLLGCEYAMLRREFLLAKKAKKKVSKSDSVSQILLTLGGADPQNLTARYLAILCACCSSDCQIHVLIGPANPHVLYFRELTAKMSRMILHVGATKVAEIMANCDLALTAAGSSVYELGYLGVPMLVVVTADNQRPIATALDQLHVAFRLRDPGDISAAEDKLWIDAFLHDPTKRARCASRFQELVDGRGAARVVAALRGEEREP